MIWVVELTASFASSFFTRSMNIVPQSQLASPKVPKYKTCFFEMTVHLSSTGQSSASTDWSYILTTLISTNNCNDSNNIYDVITAYRESHNRVKQTILEICYKDKTIRRILKARPYFWQKKNSSYLPRLDYYYYCELIEIRNWSTGGMTILHVVPSTYHKGRDYSDDW